MPSLETRTAEALKPRKALAASGKSRTVGTARSTYSGKRSTRESWRATQSPTRSPQCGSTRGHGLRRRQGHDMDAAGVAQDGRIAQKLAGLAEQAGAHAGRADQPGEELAGGVGVEAVDRGLAAGDGDLADARRHHLALHRERGELGVYQLFLVVAEIDGAQGQQRHRDDVQQQDAAGERRIAPCRAAPAAQQRGRLGRGGARGRLVAVPQRRGDPSPQTLQSEPSSGLRRRGIGIRCHKAFRSARTRRRPRGTCGAPA